jgi:protein dithiol oxidoreductase (disulfide-forming)
MAAEMAGPWASRAHRYQETTGMRRFIPTWLALAALALATGTSYAQGWKEGTNYFAVNPPQPTTVPAGKVEVMEVFSYACPACNAFQPIMKQLKATLPANAQVVYLPAAFRPDEDWPMFQRAFFAAQALGIVDKTHEAMFNAVWNTGELATMNLQTNRVKNPLPSLEDAARFYSRVAAVKQADFLAAARSFGVEAKMRMADAQIGAMQALSTPTIIINGKYRLQIQDAGGIPQTVELVKYLVAKESGAAPTAAVKKAH